MSNARQAKPIPKARERPSTDLMFMRLTLSRYRMWPATMNPSVIATSIRAPINRGGAGDGISKYLQPAPISRPTAIPMRVGAMERFARRRNSHSRARPRNPLHLRAEWARSPPLRVRVDA